VEVPLLAKTNKRHHVTIAAQCHHHSARLAGVPSRRFFTDARAFTTAQLLVTEYYGFDAPNNLWDVYNIEAEAMGQEMIYPPDGIPDVDRRKPLLRSRSDLDRLRAPDPMKSGRMPWVHEINKHYLEMTGRPARAFFCAPLSLAANIRGYENLMDDMYDDPAFTHRLFTFICDDVLAPYIEAMRKECGDSGLLADGNDAWASPPMISLDIMDEYVITYTERLRNQLGDKVVTRGNWGDAKSRDPERFWEQKLRCSPGFLSLLDPDLHELGPARARAFLDRHNVFVIAGIDAVLLQKGPVEAIVERVKTYIHVLGRGGRFAIYLNEISGATPPAHVHAAVAACRRYGEYPIAHDLDRIVFETPGRESFTEFMTRRSKDSTPSIQ
jgi:uroporphyrinogen-III decarboxylase